MNQTTHVPPTFAPTHDNRAHHVRAGLVTAGVATIIGIPVFTIFSAAHAAEVEETISNVVVSGFDATMPVAVGDEINITADWSVADNSVHSGDTFTMQLPVQLSGDSTFAMKNANGDIVANAVVKDQTVTVTFTDFVDTHPLNIKGTMYFKARVANIGNAGEPFTITWGGVSSQPITPYIPAPGVHDEHAFKRGWIDGRGVNQWSLEAPYRQGSPVVTDTPVDHSLKCETIQVGYMDIIDNGDGSKKYSDPHILDASQYNLTCSPSTFTVSYTGLHENQVLGVLIDVDMDAPRDTNHNGSLENSFTATVNGQSEGDTVFYANSGSGGTGSGENNPTPTATSTTTAPTPEPTATTAEPTSPAPTATETSPAPEPTETTAQPNSPAPTASETTEPPVQTPEPTVTTTAPVPEPTQTSTEPTSPAPTTSTAQPSSPAPSSTTENPRPSTSTSTSAEPSASVTSPAATTTTPSTATTSPAGATDETTKPSKPVSPTPSAQHQGVIPKTLFDTGILVDNGDGTTHVNPLRSVVALSVGAVVTILAVLSINALTKRRHAKNDSSMS